MGLPLPFNHNLRKYSTNLPTVQSSGAIFSFVVSSSQMTIACVKVLQSSQQSCNYLSTSYFSDPTLIFLFPSFILGNSATIQVSQLPFLCCKQKKMSSAGFPAPSGVCSPSLWTLHLEFSSSSYFSSWYFITAWGNRPRQGLGQLSVKVKVKVKW